MKTEVHLYTRDSSGVVTYRGDQAEGARDVSEVKIRRTILEHYGCDLTTFDTREAIGWPHDRITWYGDVGFGERSREDVLRAIYRAQQSMGHPSYGRADPDSGCNYPSHTRRD